MRTDKRIWAPGKRMSLGWDWSGWASIGMLLGCQSPQVASDRSFSRASDSHVVEPLLAERRHSVATSVEPPATSVEPLASSVEPLAPHVEPLVAEERQTWTIDDPQLGPIGVQVWIPAHRAGEQLGVLVALHGRGEALKGPVRGALGFVKDYGLLDAWRWLSSSGGTTAPPLPDEYRDEIVRSLRRQPFSGMIVLMPYVPDVFRGSEVFKNNAAYARILQSLAARARRELPVDGDAQRWDIDGISLGGRVALAVGPLLADRFGTVAATQAAIDPSELSQLTQLMRLARETHPHLHYALTTSSEDYYRAVLHDFHAQLTAAGVSHDFSELPGDHSYAFNRGPGICNMLLYHDRRINRIKL